MRSATKMMVRQVKSSIVLVALVAAMAVASVQSRALADTLSATDDGDVHLSAPHGQGTSAGTLTVRDVGGGGHRRAYIRFGTEPLPDAMTGEAIAKATLRLWIDKVFTVGEVDLHLVTEDWSELDLGDGPTPSVGTPFATIAIEAADRSNYLLIDITDVVRDWIDGNVENFGIAISPRHVALSISSKETGVSGHSPEIEVVTALALGGSSGSGTTGPAGPAGPPGSTGATGTTGPTGQPDRPVPREQQARPAQQVRPVQGA